MKNKSMLLIPFLLTGFLVFWIIVSHLIKNNLIKTINFLNDDNLKIFYQDVKVSGFPFKFHITFIKPTIKIINENEIKGFVFDKILVNLDLKMQNLYLSTNQEFQYKKHSANSKIISEHNIKSKEPIKISLDFEKSLATLSKSFQTSKIFKSINFPKTNFDLISDDKIYAKLEDFNIQATKISLQNNKFLVNYNISASYSPVQDDNQRFDLILNSDITRYISSNKNDRSYFTNIALNNFNIKINDDNAEFDLNGNISFPKQKQSIGLLNLTMHNYQSFISLISKKGIRSKSFLNHFITKASFEESNKDNSNDLKKVAKFTIKFTEDGIYFGNIEMNKLITESLND